MEQPNLVDHPRIGVILRRVFSTLRARPRPIVGLAVLVLLVPQAAEAVLSSRSDHLAEMGEDPTTLLGILMMVASLASTMGIVFYAGLLDHVAAEHQWGGESRSVTEIARRLPWIRLFLADVVLVFLASAAAVVLVIPGFIVFTYLALVGPIVNIDRLSLVGSFVRTARVTRGHFWLVATMVSVPVIFEGLTEDWLHQAFDHDRFVGIVLATALGVVLAALIAVTEVTLAHDLVRRRPLSPGDLAPSPLPVESEENETAS